MATDEQVVHFRLMFVQQGSLWCPHSTQVGSRSGKREATSAFSASLSTRWNPRQTTLPNIGACSFVACPNSLGQPLGAGAGCIDTSGPAVKATAEATPGLWAAKCSS